MDTVKQWMKTSYMGIVLPAVMGLLVGAGGYTFYFAHGWSYLSNDPAACVNCHIMRDVYDGWSKASHHAVAVCNDCHVPKDFFGKYLSKGLNGYHHSKAFTLGGFHEPIMIKPHNSAILEDNCLRCHEQAVSLIAHDGLLESGEWNCVHCHQSVGHGPRK